MSSNIFHLAFSDYSFRLVGFCCFILGISSGVIGCFATLRRESLLADSVSHASLAGVCLMFILTGLKSISILLFGALIVGLICVGCIHIISRYSKIKVDSSLALLLSVFFGVGLTLLTYINKSTGSNKAGLDKIIFGQAATLLKQDVYVICLASFLSLSFVYIFWKEIKLCTFDLVYAKSIGIKGELIRLALSSLLVLMVVVGLQTAGSVLVVSMIVAPAISARQWSDKLSTMIFISAFIGGISSLMGALCSQMYDVPTGPINVVFLSIFAFFSLMFAKNRGLIYLLWNRRKKERKLRDEMNDIIARTNAWA